MTVTARVLSGREALQAWILVCVNLARRSGVLSHHSNDQKQDQGRHWVTVTGIRPQATVTRDEMYAMCEQLSQAFAETAIEYSKPLPEGSVAALDSKLTDELLTNERDNLRKQIATLTARVHQLEAERIAGSNIDPFGVFGRAVQQYAESDAALSIDVAQAQARASQFQSAIAELVNVGVMGPRAREYILTGGPAIARSDFEALVRALQGSQLSTLGRALGLPRMRVWSSDYAPGTLVNVDESTRYESDEELRVRLLAWNQPAKPQPYSDLI